MRGGCGLSRWHGGIGMKQRPRQDGAVKERRPAAPAWQATLARGLALHQAGQLDEAAASYRQVLRVEPRQPDALHLLGVTALQSGRLADAESTIRRALAVAPTQPTFWNSL